MKRSRLVIVLSLVAFVGVCAGAVYFSHYATVLDRPIRLSGQTQTIEVVYIAWACDCANWLETKYFQQMPYYEVKDQDCIFIEPARAELAIPEHFWRGEGLPKRLRLTGQFYRGKGIPAGYPFQSEKPDQARVFQYHTLEIIHP